MQHNLLLSKLLSLLYKAVIWLELSFGCYHSGMLSEIIITTLGLGLGLGLALALALALALYIGRRGKKRAWYASSFECTDPSLAKKIFTSLEEESWWNLYMLQTRTACTDWQVCFGVWE